MKASGDFVNRIGADTDRLVGVDKPHPRIEISFGQFWESELDTVGLPRHVFESTVAVASLDPRDLFQTERTFTVVHDGRKAGTIRCGG